MADHISPKLRLGESPLLMTFLFWNLAGTVAGVFFAGLSAHAIFTGRFAEIIPFDAIALVVMLLMFALPSLITRSWLTRTTSRGVFATIIVSGLLPAIAIGIVLGVGLLMR